MKPFTRSLLLLTVLALTSGAATRARADVITDWNFLAIDTIRTAGLGPNPATRILAITHAAQHDAVVAILHTSEPYHAHPVATGTESVDAAAIEAAYRVLIALIPGPQRPALISAYAAALADVPDGDAKTAGIAIGQAAAADLLALRTNDGSAPPATPYTGDATTLGKWRPTPPKNLNGADPQWGHVTPFVLDLGQQFRPAAPPAVSSAAFATAFAEVASLGDVASTTRNAEETTIANFWAQATHVPFNQIARQLSANRGFDVARNARLFALLNLALADARIAIWDAKYTYSFWRPITAITIDDDGNTTTVQNPAFNSLLETPNHPEYPSGHSGTGAAGAGILRHFFGDDVTFLVTSDSLAETVRTYSSLTYAARENGRSRIYGGIHYTFSNLAGYTIGDQVAAWVYANALRVTTPPAPQADAGTADPGTDAGSVDPVADAGTVEPAADAGTVDPLGDAGSSNPPADAAASGSCSITNFGKNDGALVPIGFLLATAILVRRRRRSLDEIAPVRHEPTGL